MFSPALTMEKDAVSQSGINISFAKGMAAFNNVPPIFFSKIKKNHTKCLTLFNCDFENSIAMTLLLFSVFT